MNVHVRLSAGLAQAAGRSHLAVTLHDDATVADLIEYLRSEYPSLTSRLDMAVPVVAGQHTSHTDPLVAGEEVAFLVPIAGGL